MSTEKQFCLEVSKLIKTISIFLSRIENEKKLLFSNHLFSPYVAFEQMDRFG